MAGWKRDKSKAPRDHHAETTEKIAAKMKEGVLPWRKPWADGAGAVKDPEMRLPHNAVTGKPYRGINRLLVTMAGDGFSTGDGRAATYNQAASKGWQVKKGAKGIPIFFFSKIDVEDKKGGVDPKTGLPARVQVPVMRAHTVFPASMIDGIPPLERVEADPPSWRRPGSVAEILAASGFNVAVGDRACYNRGTETITLPPDGAFGSVESWSATALHELGHALAHKTGISGEIKARYGEQAYAMEELVVELSAAVVAMELGVDPTSRIQDDAASYIGAWTKQLDGDPKAIFKAAAYSEKVSESVLSLLEGWREARDAEAASESAESAGAVGSVDASSVAEPAAMESWHAGGTSGEVAADGLPALLPVSGLLPRAEGGKDGPTLAEISEGRSAAV